MSLQRQFEGPDVRMLLDEIRSTYGDEPTISRAETFRSGGLLGFFQREQFRLVVDAPDQADRRFSGAPKPSSGRRTPAKRRKTGKHFASSTPNSEPVPAIRVSEAGPRVTSGLGSYSKDSGSSQDSRTSRGAAPARGSRKAPSRHVPVDLFADVADSTEDKDFVTKQPEPDPSFEAVLGRVARMAGAPGDVAGRNPEGHPKTSAAAPPHIEDGEELEPLAAYVDGDPIEMDILGSELFLPTSLSVEDLSEIVASPASRYATPYDAEADSRGVASILRGELLKCGFDPESATRVESSVSAGASTLNALTCLFEAMPAPPRIPLRPGSLVVVVGEGDRATAEAARIAGEIGSDPSQVAVASPHHQDPGAREELLIRDAADAMELGPSLRRGRVGVVAVDCPTGATSTVWARHVLSALRPTLVIGVVDAMYKPEDIGRWVLALDGLDALVVDRLESTASPACLLSLAIPVLRLGDLPSTPARWTAAVADLLSDECLSCGAPEPPPARLADGARYDGATTATAAAGTASYAEPPSGGARQPSSNLRKQPRPITWPQLVHMVPENDETRSAVR